VWQTELNPFSMISKKKWINAQINKYLAHPLHPKFLHYSQNTLLLYSLVYIHNTSICNVRFNIMPTAMFWTTKQPILLMFQQKLFIPKLSKLSKDFSYSKRTYKLLLNHLYFFRSLRYCEGFQLYFKPFFKIFISKHVPFQNSNTACWKVFFQSLVILINMVYHITYILSTAASLV
jgi:hypothetical protein